MSRCPMCAGNLHLSCLHGSCDCNHQSQPTEEQYSLGDDNEQNDTTTSADSTASGIQQLDEDENNSDDDGRVSRASGRVEFSRNSSLRNSDGDDRSSSRGRESNLKDQQSTGRKRAAKLYPLDRERQCEWQGRFNCGGGRYPISGCISGKQQARHHGPDKTVSNNEAGNVHRICHYCHNRWHAANDPSYDWNNPCTTPHSPITMEFGSDEFVAAMMDEMRYLGENLGKLVKVND